MQILKLVPINKYHISIMSLSVSIKYESDGNFMNMFYSDSKYQIILVDGRASWVGEAGHLGWRGSVQTIGASRYRLQLKLKVGSCRHGTVHTHHTSG